MSGAANSSPAARETAVREAGAATPSRSRLARSNRRVALTLASIALVFFIGIIATRFIDDANTGTIVMGVAVLLFLSIAIGRNLRK